MYVIYCINKLKIDFLVKNYFWLIKLHNNFLSCYNKKTKNFSHSKLME